MSAGDHNQRSRVITPRCAIVTLSDTRTRDTDGSGAAIKRHLEADGCVILSYELLPDDPKQLNDVLGRLLERADIDVILCNGGTGVSKRDNTIDVVEARLEKVLPGFGEIFRQQSFAEIGPAAMLSRATGGIANGRAIFALPGSTAAVELAMTLITPVLRHLVFELRK